MDHVIPLSKDGIKGIENLALACFHCNRQKSDRLTAVDLESGIEVPLFNPRSDSWNQHFIWSKDTLSIIGLTPIGRATVTALDFNRQRLINIRKEDRKIRRHPPPDDPIQS